MNNINEVNQEIEKCIIMKEPFNKITNKDIIVIPNKSDENIINTITKLEENWLINNKKILFYSINQNINIENYIYASVMNCNLPKDIFKEITIKKPLQWEKYKKIMKNTELYIKNTKKNPNIYDLRNIKNNNSNIDLILVISDEINEDLLFQLNLISNELPIIIITNKIPKQNNLNIKYKEVYNDR